MRAKHALCEKISHVSGAHVHGVHNLEVEGYLHDGPLDDSGEIDVVLHLEVCEACKHGDIDVGHAATTYIPVFMDDEQAVAMMQEIMSLLMRNEILGLTAMLAMVTNTMEIHLASLLLEE